ncbi:hypothetical protein [Streptomyces sp. CT34]|uniref:hypothetical protein n=1 Tax=Streptomyces sp. CT34 TaxID=1553907 RepID=UPI0005BA6639|nr:hypothetical protein [Streptomyces sp. CT34]
MTTLKAPPATVAGTQTGISSWCSECDGRPSDRIAVFPGGNARAGLDADRAASQHGFGAHVHYIPRGDQFAVVVPRGEVR